MSNYSDSTFDESSANTSWYKAFQLIAEGSTVLDIGCSSGNFGEVLIKKKQCVVDGIELDERDVKLARKKLRSVWRLNVETDSLEEIHEKYDIVYFGDVIEHLVDPITSLQRVKSLLNPNGRVVFSIPNMGHLGIRLALLAGDFEYTETGLLDKTHLHFYTQDEVVRVFETAGYALEELDFVQKDYPKALISEHLNEYGLKATEKFYRKMQQSDAAAFQFVGVAKKAKANIRKLKQFGPIDLFESFYENMKGSYEAQVKELKDKVTTLEAELAYKKAHPYRNSLHHVKGKLGRR